jgi:peptidoglycan/LPS O-acetylase OafA/YrhL
VAVVSEIKKQKHLPGIHGLRAIAALSVVVCHTAYIPSPTLQLPWLLTPLVSNLNMAVNLFFIISVFSLMHANDHLTSESNWLLSYSIKRYFRIAPLFYVMLIYNYGNWISSLSPGPTVANLVFIFNFIPTLHDSVVWAGWTLGVEMPIYALLPLIMGRNWKAKEYLILTGMTFFIAVVSRWYFSLPNWPNDYAYISLFSNLPAFAIGALAFKIAQDQKFLKAYLRILSLTGLLGVALALVISRDQTPNGPHYEVLPWLLPLGLICISQAVRPALWLTTAPIQWVGERSFSIYLLHPFIVYKLWNGGIYNWLYGVFSVIGSGVFLICILLTILVVLMIAEISYRLIERPGQNLGRLVCKLIVRYRGALNY